MPYDRVYWSVFYWFRKISEVYKVLSMGNRNVFTYLEFLRNANQGENKEQGIGYKTIPLTDGL